MTLWEIDIHPALGHLDLAGKRVAAAARELGLGSRLEVRAARGYLLEGNLERAQVERLARELLSDAVVESPVVAQVGEAQLSAAPENFAVGKEVDLVHVLLKPGVTDSVAQSTLAAIANFGIRVSAVRTLTKYWIHGLPRERIAAVAGKLVANEAIEQVIAGPLSLSHLGVGGTYDFRLVKVGLRELDDESLMKLSRNGQLYLSLAEMKTIQAHFRDLDREPTDVELETLAQTWSEHCSHKTLAGRIAYRDERGERKFENMLKETIFAATVEIRKQLGDNDWCVSVFKDNAGIVKFDERNNVVFKVETHNHPSALEPYGGANTGLGGVIRDPLGTGMGAKPICSTDVFCFAPPHTSADSLPPGVLHPRRVMQGVVSGVRDYGNRMGIPTVNGAVYFDSRYLGNPLVYCGNVGLIPCDKSFKQPMANDFIVAMGGRTGRDGIHGATFSSAELTSESETISGGAVQIGNAITEKMVLDCVLAARDRGLFNAITDCGAGGFSSAVGEMGEEIGAEVWLDKAPLKYAGLSYTETWISEAQERMILSVSPDKWEAFHALCAAEGVEATVIGKFAPTGRLRLFYQDNLVGDLSMEFLHGGRPPVVREAVYAPAAAKPIDLPVRENYNAALHSILSSLNVASKEWIIRQYDHEVQGGSVIKPLVGVANDGPSDASVVRPVLDSYRGIAISCGMNPRYGDFDTALMAGSAIDEAMRNCVAVGADPSRIAILDNFCWGYTDRAETLGSLVRAAIACHDAAVTLGTPFISGKDSLNNEFRYVDANGESRVIAIPASLLISALGWVPDVRRCVSMDLKGVGNLVYIVGITRHELGGSHFSMVEGLSGGAPPSFHAASAKSVFAAMHAAISAGCIRACHDLSEGGLAVAAAEMAFAGGLGLALELEQVVCDGSAADLPASLLFSESNTRFLCEVPDEMAAKFESLLTHGVPHRRIGTVMAAPRLQISFDEGLVIDADLAALKESWQAPLRW